MKLIKADQEHLCFQLDETQRSVLTMLLGFYPLVPLAHQRLSRATDNPGAQKLLDEALAAQRGENKSHVQRFLKSFTFTGENQYSFSLPRPQIEWLLQVLNDVHVGSWILLGSPNDKSQIFDAMKNASLHRYLWAREVAQIFLYQLLHAVESGDVMEPPAGAS